MKKMIGAVALFGLTLIAFAGASHAAQGGASNSAVFHGSYVKDSLKPQFPIYDDGDGSPDAQEVITWDDLSVKRVFVGSSAGDDHCRATLRPRVALTPIDPYGSGTHDHKLVMVGADDPQRDILCNALIRVVGTDMGIDAQVVDVQFSERPGHGEEGYLIGITIK